MSSDVQPAALPRPWDQRVTFAKDVCGKKNIEKPCETVQKQHKNPLKAELCSNFRWQASFWKSNDSIMKSCLNVGLLFKPSQEEIDLLTYYFPSSMVGMLCRASAKVLWAVWVERKPKEIHSLSPRLPCLRSQRFAGDLCPLSTTRDHKAPHRDSLNTINVSTCRMHSQSFACGFIWASFKCLPALDWMALPPGPSVQRRTLPHCDAPAVETGWELVHFFGLHVFHNILTQASGGLPILNPLAKVSTASVHDDKPFQSGWQSKASRS